MNAVDNSKRASVESTDAGLLDECTDNLRDIHLSKRAQFPDCVGLPHSGKSVRPLDTAADMEQKTSPARVDLPGRDYLWQQIDRCYFCAVNG
jgi:hypothetical protein